MALSDCTLQDFVGAALTAVHAMDPEGYWVGKPVAATGAQVFSVVGPAATYYTVVTDPDMGMGIVCTSSPVPDNWNGLITIRQTDPVDGTHDTSFALGVTGSAGKPTTGLWADTPTIHWLRRKVVMDHLAAERTLFYDPGATYTTTLTATTIAELNTHYNTLKAAANGTSNYRILCAWNGLLTGAIFPSNCNFGTGHLLVTAAPGYEPGIISSITVYRNWSGVIFREVGFVPSGAYAFRFSVAGAGTAYYPRVMWSKCKIGNKAWEVYGATQVYANWQNFLLAAFAQEVIIDEECEIDGVRAFLLGTVRTLVVTPKFWKNAKGDLFAPYAQYDGSKPTTFANDNMYWLVSPNMWAMVDDYSNSASGDPLHKDFMQFRDATGTARTCSIHVHIENTFLCAGGYTYQKASTSNFWATPQVQVTIDNASSLPNVTTEISVFNANLATGAPRGFWPGLGDLSLAWGSFPAADRHPTATGLALAVWQQKQGSKGKNHVWRCVLSDQITGTAPRGLYNYGSNTKFHHQKNIHVDFTGSSTAQTQPSAVCRGDVVPFARSGGDDNLWDYALNYDQAADAFENDLSRQTHHKASSLATSAGARLRETHVVTPPGGAAVTFTIAA